MRNLVNFIKNPLSPILTSSLPIHLMSCFPLSLSATNKSVSQTEPTRNFPQHISLPPCTRELKRVQTKQEEPKKNTLRYITPSIFLMGKQTMYRNLHFSSLHLTCFLFFFSLLPHNKSETRENYFCVRFSFSSMRCRRKVSLQLVARRCTERSN